MGRYTEEFCRTMEFLSQDPHVVFLGQAVSSPGTVMTTTLINVPKEKKIELPVFEETQMGLSTGMALAGFIPITFYPRYNFLLLALNQTINHLDKIKHLSRDKFQPKVIIRTSIGSDKPLDPQCQHLGDFTEALRLMLTNIEVIKLAEPEDIFPAYEKALKRDDGMSTVCVEFVGHHQEK